MYEYLNIYKKVQTSNIKSAVTSKGRNTQLLLSHPLFLDSIRSALNSIYARPNLKSWICAALENIKPMPVSHGSIGIQDFGRIPKNETVGKNLI